MGNGVTAFISIMRRPPKGGMQLEVAAPLFYMTLLLEVVIQCFSAPFRISFPANFRQILNQDPWYSIRTL